MRTKQHRSNKAWIEAHVHDPFVQRAQREGYRARAAYKLMEIDDRDRLIRPGMTVVDLGAAPGSWSQVLVQRMQGQGRIIALDMLDMPLLPHITFIRGDFREEAVLAQLTETLAGEQVDLVISDMAPNISGVSSMDQARAAYLVELALLFCAHWLKPGGNFLVKAFAGSDFEETLRTMRGQFNSVVIRKPKASRNRSSETYLLGLGLRG